MGEYGDMQVIVHRMPAGSSFDVLASLPRQQLVRDWWGNEVNPPFEFAMAENGERLFILASRRKTPRAQPGSRPGELFPKPLCDYDVAEFFLGQKAGGRYFEFHIAPSGAWWYSFFKAVRQTDAEDNPVPQGVETQTRPLKDGWLAMAGIPLPGLDGLSLDACRLAVTAILEFPDSIYLTTAAPSTGEPDFHRPDDWTPPAIPRTKR